MNKRLRKKKFRGEFRELGFRIAFRYPSDLAVSQSNDLLDRFYSEAIEGNGMVCAGWEDGAGWDAFATAHRPGKNVRRHGSVTEAQREAVEKWLRNEKAILRYSVGPLEDDWR